jgi:hypothetical protein
MLAAYLNFFLAGYALLNSNISVSTIEKVSKAILYFFIILGFLQFFNLTKIINPILEMLVSRGSFTNEGSSRGVSLISTEPARASVEVALLYFIYRLTKKSIIADLFIFIFLTLIIKSATGLMVYILLMSVLYIKEKNYFIISLLFLVIVISSTYIFSLDINSRAFLLLVKITELNSGEIIQLLTNTSGPRVFSFLIIPNFILNYPFSLGFGNWQLSSYVATELSGINYMELNWFKYNPGYGFRFFRMPGLALNLIIDFGIFAFFLICFYFYSLDKNILKIDYTYVLILLILFTGSPGSPFYLIPLIYLIKKSNANKKYTLVN